MQITLRIAGEDKTFSQDFISARMFRRAIEMEKHLRTGSVDVNKLDDMIGFVVDAYGKQFTIDDFYDGLQSSKLMPTIVETINHVVGRITEEVGTEDPNQKPAQ